MSPRIEKELGLLRRHYPDVEHNEVGGEDWFRLPSYPFPLGWLLNNAAISKAPVVFKVTAAHPGAEPYAFLTPAGVTFNGTAPNNAGAAACPAFPGAWLQFSWSPDGTWTPTADIEKGSNLYVWVRSFAKRLAEGV